MRRSKKNKSVFWFLISILFIVSFAIWIRPSSRDEVILEEPFASKNIPTVFIKEDSCTALLKHFCGNHGNVAYNEKSNSNTYRISIEKFGANPQLFYNNNKEITKIKDKGFNIEVHTDTLIAVFNRKRINGVFCVELPTDVLYALMLQHPSIR